MQSVPRRLSYLGVGILFLAFLAQLALAQIDTGAIVGVVRDPSGPPFRKPRCE